MSKVEGGIATFITQYSSFTMEVFSLRVSNKLEIVGSLLPGVHISLPKTRVGNIYILDDNDELRYKAVIFQILLPDNSKRGVWIALHKEDSYLIDELFYFIEKSGIQIIYGDL